MVVYSGTDVLTMGLSYIGHNPNSRAGRKTKLKRFREGYGSRPQVYAQIWLDLQSTDNPEARINPKKDLFFYFMMGIHFLKTYKTRGNLAGTFHVHEDTASSWAWYFVRKIRALKGEKVRLNSFLSESLFFAHISPLDFKIKWPDRWDDEHATADDLPVFVLSVDGTHCKVHEQKHPTKAKDPSWYSFKHKSAGVNYEVGLSVYENKCIWMHGPFKASKHDMTIFRKKLLKKIPRGKRVIGDNGYRGESDIVSTPNSHDPDVLRKFKVSF